MLVKVNTGNVHGVDAYRVVVEVDASRGGMPGYSLVGLPSARVTEGKVRVRAAILNSGYKLESRRVTVNLAPAELRKDTAAFDLPIALGTLGAYELLPPEAFAGRMALGELALDGGLRRVNGVLPVADLAHRLGMRELLVPRENAEEAAVVSGLQVRAASTLQEVARHLSGAEEIPLYVPGPEPPPASALLDLAAVKGQAGPKRALEIAAAGGHNLLLVGPPGSGKSMLARRLPSILPPLTFAEGLEVTRIYSVTGLLGTTGLIRERPFRAPHHTVSQAGLVGGGPGPRPGELSLAHNGVLFLDELLEFQRPTLEALRQPLEDRQISITRARASMSFPADVQLVAAMNPCPCGHRGDPRRTCTCSNGAIERYWSRLSGPLMDRIDLLLDVPAVSFEEMTGDAATECSADVRSRVIAARRRQENRPGPGRCNARLEPEQYDRDCAIDAGGHRILKTAVERMGLSARAMQRVVKVARTIADLGDAADIAAAHVAEAIAYRRLVM